MRGCVCDRCRHRHKQMDPHDRGGREALPAVQISVMSKNLEPSPSPDIFSSNFLPVSKTLLLPRFHMPFAYGTNYNQGCASSKDVGKRKPVGSSKLLALERRKLDDYTCRFVCIHTEVILFCFLTFTVTIRCFHTSFSGFCV